MPTSFKRRVHVYNIALLPELHLSALHAHVLHVSVHGVLSNSLVTQIDMQAECTCVYVPAQEASP